jgi:beta-phosphoglucomutase
MIRGVIFDLDGVIVLTDELHFQSWMRLTAEEGIPFDRALNQRLRGLGRLESLAIVLERAPRTYTPAEQAGLAKRKQAYFLDLAQHLTAADLLPGVVATITELRRRGIKTAVGSSSRNTALILEHLGLRDQFDAVADRNDVLQSKPDPAVFLLAAKRLGLQPAECLVIEDAVAGVESARRAGMAVFGIGPPEQLPGIARLAPDLTHVTVDELLH